VEQFNNLQCTVDKIIPVPLLRHLHSTLTCITLVNLYVRHTVFTDKVRQSLHDITAGLLLHQLSAGSWMSLGHQGGMTSTVAPTSKEGLTFPFYCLICLYDKLTLP